MLKNKRAEGYVQVCVLTIVICMILSVFITFAGAVNVVRLTEKNTKTVLENFVMKNSILIYDSVKQGTNRTDEINGSVFVSDLARFCTFEKHGDMYYHTDEDGRTGYYISSPEVGFTETGKLRLYVKYTLYIPLYFNGVQITTAQIPLTVKTDLEQKF